MQIGERVLLPEVRKADRETIVVSDGFSCRQQIAHGTSRKAMHTAEVLQMALQSQQTPLAPAKKRRFLEDGRTQLENGPGLFEILLGAGILASTGFLLTRNSRQRTHPVEGELHGR